MSFGLLYGVWTYRSFYNVAESVDDLGKLLLAEGELVFEDAPANGIRGQLAFRSSPPDPNDARLVLVGSMQDGAAAAARFQGVGVSGTGADGWVYDYVGYLVPKWPNGKGQQDALVGSVVRTVSHPGSGGSVRPAGEVFSFVAVRRAFVEPSQAIPLPRRVRNMLASRHHRLHHMVWHGVRNLWLNPDVTDAQRDQITALGWAPRQPALDDKATPLLDNGSGEDFLFMHRQMVLEVNAQLQASGEEPIQSWKSIPPPGALMQEPDFTTRGGASLPPAGNPDGFTVPPTWFHPQDEGTNRRIAALKTDEYFWSRMRWWDRGFKNPHYLATLTLGELGALLEWSIHNDMHMRWASVPRDPRTGEPVPAGRADPDVSKKWDDPAYDFLGEFYSSHVNPVFWRLHGWVDDRVNDWFAAHEAAHKGQVKPKKVGGVPWFQKGKWVSASHPWAGPAGMMHGPHAGRGHPARADHDEEIRKMEEVVAILFGTAAQPATFALADIEPRLPTQAIGRRLTWF